MNYKNKTFAVGAPGTAAYRDNWERTFRGESVNTPAVHCDRCGQVFDTFSAYGNHPCDAVPAVDDGLPHGTNEA